MRDATDQVLVEARRVLREAVGHRSIEVAAGIAGVSPRTLSRILRGRPCGILTLARVCRAFGRELRLSLAPKETATHCGARRGAGASSGVGRLR